MYEIYKLHMYLAKTCTVPTLYSVNIILNLERPINVRRYFDSRKYEKLTKKVIHACKNITEKNDFV